jgi:outer membrane protein assembly factor BamB
MKKNFLYFSLVFFLFSCKKDASNIIPDGSVFISGFNQVTEINLNDGSFVSNEDYNLNSLSRNGNVFFYADAVNNIIEAYDVASNTSLWSYDIPFLENEALSNASRFRVQYVSSKLVAYYSKFNTDDFESTYHRVTFDATDGTVLEDESFTLEQRLLGSVGNNIYVYEGSPTIGINALDAGSISFLEKGFVSTSPSIPSSILSINNQPTFGIGNNLKAYNSNLSSDKWTFSAGDVINTFPIYNNDRIYLSARNKKLYCLNSTNGIASWSIDLINRLGKPLLANNSGVFWVDFISESDFSTVKLNHSNVNGNLQWTKEIALSEDNIGEAPQFLMTELPNHLILTIKMELSSEYFYNISLIEKSKGEIVWQVEHTSEDGILTNQLITSNSKLYLNN